MAEPKYKGLFCRNPFQEFFVTQEGDVHACCPSWLPLRLGNLNENSFEEVWNSRWAQRLRETMYDGTFRYCVESACPHLSGDAGPMSAIDEIPDPKLREIVAQEKTVLDEGPRRMVISYDPTCNLECPSCRCGYKVAKGEEFSSAERLHQRVLGSAFLANAEVLWLPGNGEAFSSRIYRNLLRTWDTARFPHLGLHLLTNGLLLTEGMWATIKQAHPAIRDLKVSVNATRPDTFAEIQKGGDFHKLLENLRFMQQLRARGELEVFILSFVVQARNFREMKEFVLLAKELGADSAVFSTLVNWGTFDDPAFTSRAVNLPSHPDHAELIELLRDPIFNDPIVELGMVRPLHPDFYGTAPATAQAPEAPCTLDELAKDLLLSSVQKETIRALIDAHHDEIVALMNAPSAEGLAPFDVITEGIRAGLGQAEWFARLQQFGSTTIEPKSGMIYQARVDQLRAELNEAICRVLEPDQLVVLRAYVRTPLFEVSTGYDPSQPELLARIEGRPRPQPAANSWPAIRAHFRLTPAQAAACLAIVDELKSGFAELCASPAASGRPAPVVCLAEMLQAGDPRAQEQFITYLSAERPVDGSGSYLSELRLLEGEQRQRIAALLLPAQRAALDTLPVNSLLDIETGSDPLKNAIERVLQPSAGGADTRGPREVRPVCTWDGFRIYLSLGPGQLARVRGLIGQLQRDYAALLAQAPRGGGEPPQQYAPSAHEQNGAAKAFMAYLANEVEPASGASFLATAEALEQRCREALQAMLNRPQSINLRDLPLGTLIGLDMADAGGAAPAGASAWIDRARATPLPRLVMR